MVAKWRPITGVLEARRLNTAAITRKGCAGSIYSVGRDFQSFGINDLEMVDQNSASWNRIAVWLRRLDGLRGVFRLMLS